MLTIIFSIKKLKNGDKEANNLNNNVFKFVNVWIVVWIVIVLKKKNFFLRDLVKKSYRC